MYLFEVRKYQMYIRDNYKVTRAGIFEEMGDHYVLLRP